MPVQVKYQTSYIAMKESRELQSHKAPIFHNEDITKASWRSFFFPAHATKNGMFTLPANVSELHSVVCGNLSREVKVGKVHQWHKAISVLHWN